MTSPGGRTRSPDFIIAAGAKYDFKPGQLTALGYSNGANIAASLLLLRPEVLTRAVLLRPMVVLQPEQLPDLSGRDLPAIRPTRPHRAGRSSPAAGPTSSVVPGPMSTCTGSRPGIS